MVIMSKLKFPYCLHCDEKVNITLLSNKTPFHFDWNDKEYDLFYTQYTAYCCKCGEEIYDPDVNDYNVYQCRMLAKAMIGVEENDKAVMEQMDSNVSFPL